MSTLIADEIFNSLYYYYIYIKTRKWAIDPSEHPLPCFCQVKSDETQLQIQAAEKSLREGKPTFQIKLKGAVRSWRRNKTARLLGESLVRPKKKTTRTTEEVLKGNYFLKIAYSLNSVLKVDLH